MDAIVKQNKKNLHSRLALIIILSKVLKNEISTSLLRIMIFKNHKISILIHPTEEGLVFSRNCIVVFTYVC